MWKNWLVLLLLLASIASAKGQDSRCVVCGKSASYIVTDKALNEKVFVCHDCLVCLDECYVCSLPVKVNYTKLPDGRFLCARDVKTVILDEDKALDLCDEVKDALDRLFSRFLTLPANVHVSLADRVDLYDMFEVKGKDFECPDILGYISSQTNQTGMKHSISMMTALPRAEFKATYAHEFAHAWVFENVTSNRRKTLSRDAHEGFCEWMAFMLMNSQQEEGQKRRMLRNNYTRGQIDLFIEAEKKHGINDVLDWVRWGVNSRLRAGNVSDIRNVEMPRAKPVSHTNLPSYVNTVTPVPNTLMLKGISASKNQPLALINNQSLAPGESAKVRVGTSNVLVRCLTIAERSVRVQLVDSGQEMELHLAPEK